MATDQTQEQSNVAPMAAAPGWYYDATNPGFNRYWNGSEWTENWSEVPGSAPGSASRLTHGAQPTAKQETNKMAIVSLVLGLVPTPAFFVTSPIAVIVGHVALSQIRKSGEGGRGLAIAGLALGYTAIIAVVGLIAAVQFLKFAGF